MEHYPLGTCGGSGRAAVASTLPCLPRYMGKVNSREIARSLRDALHAGSSMMCRCRVMLAGCVRLICLMSQRLHLPQELFAGCPT